MTAAAKIGFDRPVEARGSEALREEVRDFLRNELAHVPLRHRARSWNGYDEEFSRKLGERGWIGMVWPKRYGGHERSALERYVVIEELLAAGAPVLAHWTADRQVGPLLLAVGTEEQRQKILPGIAAGELRLAIGLSEPGAGSDLAAVQTRARTVEGGFVVDGTKLWTTVGPTAHFIVLLCRTDGTADDRHAGLSQLLIDMTSPGITVSPIRDMTGAAHFAEIRFENVFVPGDGLIGIRGNGWQQVMGELAFERSGPERFLSAMPLVEGFCQRLREQPSDEGKRTLGRIVTHVAMLRRLSLSIAGMLDRGEDPALQASIVKDLGATLEQQIPDMLRAIFAPRPTIDGNDEFAAALMVTLLNSPCFSLRGGTREILRGIIARGLGLR